MSRKNRRQRCSALARFGLACVVALSSMACGAEDSSDVDTQAPSADVDPADADELRAIGAAQRAGRPLDIDPCTLVTRADVERTLGVEILDPRTPEAPGIDLSQMPVRMCELASARPGLHNFIVSVSKQSTTVDQFRRKLAAIEKIGETMGTRLSWTPVADVGDVAAWTTTGLRFVRNEVEVEVIDIGETRGDAPPESTLSLARLIAKRL